MQDNLVDVQPHLTQLQQSNERLRALGQPGPSDEILRLAALYDDLKEQAGKTQDKLTQAVKLRETYYSHKGELETCLRQCEEQTEAVNVLGVTVPTKMDRYKVAGFFLLISIYTRQSIKYFFEMKYYISVESDVPTNYETKNVYMIAEYTGNLASQGARASIH